MKTNEMNMNEMEQVNGGFIDKYDVAMFLMKLLLPDPCRRSLPADNPGDIK